MGLFVFVVLIDHSVEGFNHLQCFTYFLRSSLANNPWVRLVTAMLTRCTEENKQSLGDEVLKICRSLYNTTQMLPVEVSRCFEWLS